jgi:N-acetyl-alpha-D-glucosaminyl L-malate synthase BshA
MKIAISCHASQGGSGVVATELAQALAERGHEVHIVACTRPFRYDEASGVRFHKVNIPHYPLFRFPPHDLSLANKLAQVTKEHGLDIIHSHYAVPHAVTGLLAKQIVAPEHRVKIVTTLHGTDITLVGSHSDFYDLVRHAILRSDGVTAVSSWLSHETSKRFSLARRPDVIPNFVDTSRFHPEGHVPHPGPEGEFILVHASNLRPVKRIAHIIRVFQQVQEALPARLVVLGDGPDKGMAMELAAELQLSERISFDGISREMPRVLRNAHLYLLLSDYESFGLSALEAMACGTPAAVSYSGGLPEVVAGGKGGILCPVNDVNYAARKIIELLADPEKWRAASEAAAAVARERFNANILIPQYEALYARALERLEDP